METFGLTFDVSAAFVTTLYMGYLLLKANIPDTNPFCVEKRSLLNQNVVARHA